MSPMAAYGKRDQRVAPGTVLTDWKNDPLYVVGENGEYLNPSKWSEKEDRKRRKALRKEHARRRRG